MVQSYDHAIDNTRKANLEQIIYSITVILQGLTTVLSLKAALANTADFR